MSLQNTTSVPIQAKMMSDQELTAALAEIEIESKRKNLTAIDVKNISDRRDEILAEIKSRI